jgi:hypothetical protein
MRRWLEVRADSATTVLPVMLPPVLPPVLRARQRREECMGARRGQCRAARAASACAQALDLREEGRSRAARACV